MAGLGLQGAKISRIEK